MEFSVPEEVPLPGELPTQPEETGADTGFSLEPLETYITLGDSALKHIPELPLASDWGVEMFTPNMPEEVVGPDVSAAWPAERYTRERAYYEAFKTDREVFDASVADRREEVLAEVGVPSYDEGMNVDGNRRAVEALGMTVNGGHYNVSALSKPLLEGALVRRGIIVPGEEWAQGEYFPSLGLAVVDRTYDSNPVVHDIRQQHEFLHSTAGYSDEEPVDMGQAWLSSDGRSWSGLIEYDGYNSLFAEEGLVHMFTNGLADYVGTLSAFDASFQHIDGAPRRYAADFHYNAGAMAWEAVFAVKPDLIDTAVASRADIEAYLQLRGDMDMIRPGLLGDMQRVAPRSLSGMPRSPWPSFDSGLDMVLDATGVGRDELRDVCENGPAIQYIKNRLHAYEQRTGYRFRTT